MNNLPGNVTQEDCERYGSMCTDEVTIDEFIDSVKNGDGWCINSAPEAVQVMYQEWLRDDHYPLSPVNKDHSDELWDKFLESLTQGKVTA